MTIGMHSEVALAAGYAVFLVALAMGLEWLARQSHNRSRRYHTAGFTYDSKIDIWVCPRGEQLARAQTDYERKIVTYRAPATACNACDIRQNCTNSDRGRELEYHLDSWMNSGLRHFHRGLSLTILLLATLILTIETIRYRGATELTLLFSLLTLNLGLGARLVVSFFAL